MKDFIPIPKQKEFIESRAPECAFVSTLFSVGSTTALIVAAIKQAEETPNAVIWFYSKWCRTEIYFFQWIDNNTKYIEREKAIKFDNGATIYIKTFNCNHEHGQISGVYIDDAEELSRQERYKLTGKADIVRYSLKIHSSMVCATYENNQYLNLDYIKGAKEQGLL
jgi:hypothetical protein